MISNELEKDINLDLIIPSKKEINKVSRKIIRNQKLDIFDILTLKKMKLIRLILHNKNSKI